MKVLVVTNMAPFVRGGAEELADELCRQLVVSGHQSELMRIPFQWDPVERIPSQMAMTRLLEVTNVDHVIALKFPAYLIRHPRKTMWLVHQFRQAYDLFDAGQSHFADTPDHNAVRAMIGEADAEAIAESRGVYVISPVVRDRMRAHNGLESTVLRPPMIDPHLFEGGTSGDYVFVGGRINAMKRQHLVIEALARADSDVRLVVAGPPDTPEDGARIVELVERLGLGSRVHLDLRFLPRETYATYLRESRAVAYMPFDEDSLGYVTIEAAQARKPVITVSDSGGVLGLVRDGVTGWVTEPDREQIAVALNQASRDRLMAATLGDAAGSLWASFGIDWASTIEVLLQ